MVRWTPDTVTTGICPASGESHAPIYNPPIPIAGPTRGNNMNNRKECKFSKPFAQNLFIFCFDSHTVWILILHLHYLCHTFRNFFEKIFLFFFLFFYLSYALVNTIFVPLFHCTLPLYCNQKHHLISILAQLCCCCLLCTVCVCLCDRRNHKDCVFRYMGFPMVDAPTTDISRYFYVASKFIDSAISSGGKWCGNGSGVSSVNKNLEKFSKDYTAVIIEFTGSSQNQFMSCGNNLFKLKFRLQEFIDI